jgi:hypothetical protein
VGGGVSTWVEGSATSRSLLVFVNLT